MCVVDSAGVQAACAYYLAVRLFKRRVYLRHGHTTCESLRNQLDWPKLVRSPWEPKSWPRRGGEP
jgi:hypothetical protein